MTYPYLNRGPVIPSRWLRATVCAVLLLLTTRAPAQSVSNQMADLSLVDYLTKVVERNESIQNKILEVEFNQRRLAAERGTFEPVLFSEISHDVTKRENTTEQQLNQSGNSIFKEHNNIYQGGIESLVPSGAQVRLGYNLRDLNNNLPSSIFSSAPHTNAEYQTFFGLTLSQPLLKGAWLPANLAATRVAALSSDMAYQDYRRQMMTVLSTAVANYWNLYLAQEQLRYFQDSVATAEKILNDNRKRAQAGKGSELDVLEAESGLALRQSKLSEARQKLSEAINQVLSMYSGSVFDSNRTAHAVDLPAVRSEQYSFFDSWKTARDVNPDYLSQRLKATQERVRLAYAKNQRLPELNLKASYGLNGLGQTPGESWDDIERAGFPSWSIGAEFRVPLGGNIRGRNELIAARLRQREAIVGLHEIETQIANAIDNALHKISSARDGVQSYQAVVKFNRTLLDSALARLEVGRIESRKILDIEADLLEARNSAAQMRVQYQRAVLELELIKGSLLKKYHFDLTQRELQTLTAQLARHGELSDEEYQDFIRDVRETYDVKRWPKRGTDTPEQIELRRKLESTRPAKRNTGTPASAASESADPLTDALHQRMEQLKP